MKKWVIVGVAVILVVVAGFFGYKYIYQSFFNPTNSTIQDGVSSAEDVETVAQKLTVPWEVAFLPNGDLLVTERPGTLKRVGENQKTYKIEGVKHVGEGGLMGLALHPNFQSNQFVYLYLTTEQDDKLKNRIERYKLTSDELTNREIILDNIPGAQYHDGGEIAFGPDGKLYATTGDAGQEQAAQNTNSLAGKILRLNDDGTVPSDNPFKNAVYSYGHRNPQGIAWDKDGQLWSTEHGPSGFESGHDELNLIKKGGNYGWPVIRGDEIKEGMIAPVVQSGSDETWAPAGLAYYDGSLFFAGLRGETLYEAKISRGNQVSLKAHFREEYGRLRAVAASPSNLLYLTTSNRDGRGKPAKNDDKVIQINPAVFK